MSPVVLPNAVVFQMVEETISRGEKASIPFRGVSMLPILREGDVITLKPVLCPLQKGDVILFRIQGRHILHRILSIHNDTIITRGDNCITSETIAISDVVAILTAVRRKSGKVLNCTSRQWRYQSHYSIAKGTVRRFSIQLLSRNNRRWMSPVYFVGLACLMWLPLGGVPLDNFYFGIRADHLVHASVYIPCSLFLMDYIKGSHGPHRRRSGLFLLWLCSVLIGCTTECGQYILPYRSFDINDLIANTLGVSLGWMLLRFRK